MKFTLPNILSLLRSWVINHKKLVYWLLIGIAGYFVLVPRCKFRDPYSTVITDRQGILLGARVSDDGQWRFPGSDSIPQKIIKCTLAFEDRYYYSHPGINPVSMCRALFQNIKAGHVVSGGSTVTMQTIRLARPKKRRNIAEKLLEMIMATRLELEKSKSEILALYFSHAPYGGNVVGIQAASWRYFGIQPADLSWAEAAALAVLPNSPALVHPGKNRILLIKKRNKLLNKLYQLGWIDKTTLITALAEKIPDKPTPMPQVAPHLLNRVYHSNPQQKVQTTIDKYLQENVSQLVELHHNRQKSNEIQNAAAIVIEVETGNIVAYVGNCGYPYEKNNSNDVDIILSRRSTGSLLKPLLYAAMLDDGKILPASLVDDIPVNIQGFSPQNYDGQYEGMVPASKALSRSLNVPAIQLLRRYTVERFHLLLKNLGMTTLSHPSGYYGLSLILGGAEGTLEDMTNIYASLSRVLSHYSVNNLYSSDDYRKASYILSKKQSGKNEGTQPAILSASAIWFAYQAMIEVNRPEQESGWQYFRSARKIAWKTGTSFGYRDAWAIGTSSKYVVGVWMGNADGEGRPGLTGISAAAPLLFDIFSLLPESRWFEEPLDEMRDAVVCKASGFLAGPNCNATDTIKIPASGLKSPACPFHQLIHLNAENINRVNSDCYPVDKMNHTSWFVLPPVQEWYYKKRHSDYKRLPPFADNCGPVGQKSMGLIYPRDEVKIYVPRGITGEKERVVFEAVHTNPQAVIYWHLDNQFITSTRYIHQIELLPSVGKHQLILVDDRGEELIKNFEIIEP